VRDGAWLGSVWDFARMLHESGFREGRALRFAVTQSGSGGRPAWEWGFGYARGLEFQLVVDTMLGHLEEEPNTTGYLHAVVINQGERETATGVDWAASWAPFVDSVRSKYGSHVQIYIQSLNGLNLMPLQASKEPNWTNTRDAQFSLATGSGSQYERCRTFVFDSNELGGSENTGLYVRDSNVHYSDLGIQRLAEGTYGQFEDANGF